MHGNYLSYEVDPSSNTANISTFGILQQTVLNQPYFGNKKPNVLFAAVIHGSNMSHLMKHCV